MDIDKENKMKHKIVKEQRLSDEVVLEVGDSIKVHEAIDKNLLRELGFLVKQYDIPIFFQAVWEMSAAIWRSLSLEGKQKHGTTMGQVSDSLAKAGSLVLDNNISFKNIKDFLER